MSAAVLRADALRLPLADESVDLVVSSPPYWQLRSYRDDDAHYSGQLGSEASPQAFLESLWAVMAEVWRVLKPTGSAFLNLGDKYASHQSGRYEGGSLHDDRNLSYYTPGSKRRFFDVVGVREKSLVGLPWRFALGCIDGEAAPDGQRWILRAEIVWSKPNGLPESVTDRVRRSHEQWFHMVKSPRYFSAVDEVREPSLIVFTAPQDGTRRHAAAMDAGEHHRYDLRTNNPLGKLPGSVWTVPSEPLIVPEAVARHYDLPDHFAAFPQEWPRRIILGWSPSGICVECGEGRRPVVAKDKIGTRRSVAGVGVGRGSFRENQNGFNAPGDTRAFIEATITGYICACPDDTAPTRPAVVADPFGGTGTTAMVARTLGRFGVSVDLSADYCRLARWRIFESGHGEKAAQRTHRDNQGDLFGNAPSVHCEDVVIAAELL